MRIIKVIQASDVRNTENSSNSPSLIVERIDYWLIIPQTGIFEHIE